MTKKFFVPYFADVSNFPERTCFYVKKWFDFSQVTGAVFAH